LHKELDMFTSILIHFGLENENNQQIVENSRSHQSLQKLG